MHVGADDRAALLACFEETSPLAFGVLCRLTAGDTDTALDLVVDTYNYMGRKAASSRGIDVDMAWLVDAVHSAYAALPPRPGHGEIEPVASLSARERVVVHLHEVEGWPRSAIATLLGTAEAEIGPLLISGRAALGGADRSAIADVFRRCEVWFDDTMRAEARARLGGRRPVGSATDDPPPAAASAATGLLSRRTLMRAGAVASIGALAGIGVWLGSGTDGEPEEAGVPTAPQARSGTTTATTPKVSAADTQVSPGTIVLDSATGEVAVVASGSMDGPPTGFIVDPLPLRLLPAGGYMDRAAVTPNWMQVWASADADHTDGRWLALLAMDSARSSQTVEDDARRVVIGGHSGVLRLQANGAARAMVALSDTVQVEARAFGFTGPMLDLVFASMTVDDDHQPSLAAGAGDVLAGLDLVVSRPSSEVSVGDDVINGDRSSLYTSADRGQYVSIVAGPQRAGDLFATRLLSEPSIIQTTIAYSSERTISVDGRQMLIGALDELGPDLFIQFHDGGYTVTVSGNVKLTTLFEMAANTRLATFDEWSLQQKATVPTPAAERPDPSSDFFFGTDQLVQIGQVTTSSDSEWTISINAADVGDAGRVGVRIEHGLPGTDTSTRSSTFGFVVPDADHPVSAFLEASATIVIGVFDSPGPATAMRVIVDSKAPEDVPLITLGETTRSAAAYAFADIADYTVALVDVGGSVVQAIAV